jgi:hypothetical protein
VSRDIRHCTTGRLVLPKTNEEFVREFCTSVFPNNVENWSRQFVSRLPAAADHVACT